MIFGDIFLFTKSRTIILSELSKNKYDTIKTLKIEVNNIIRFHQSEEPLNKTKGRTINTEQNIILIHLNITL